MTAITVGQFRGDKGPLAIMADVEWQRSSRFAKEGF